MKKTSVSQDSEILIPDFTLPSTLGGKLISSADFRQKSNLVLFFFHDWSCGHCRRLLRTLKENRRLFQWLDAAVLAIARAPLPELAHEATELQPEITLLSDETGRVAQSFLGEDGDASLPFLVIADRYGAFFSRIELSQGEDIDFREVESVLLFIATQCPECGRPRGDTIPRER